MRKDPVPEGRSTVALDESAEVVVRGSASRRDSLIVAWHEVPGKMRKDPRPIGTIDSSPGRIRRDRCAQVCVPEGQLDSSLARSARENEKRSPSHRDGRQKADPATAAAPFRHRLSIREIVVLKTDNFSN
jgi:hypothetical protein